MKVWVVTGFTESGDENCDYGIEIDSIWIDEKKAKKQAERIWGGSALEWVVNE